MPIIPLEHRSMTKILKFLALCIAAGAVAGAIMMWTDPSGESWGGGPMLELLRAKMPWPDVFFRDFVPSGFVLLAVNGLTQLLAAVMLFKKHPRSGLAVLASGVILMLWIVLEWWAWGFNPMSNIFFVLGIVEAALALLTIRKG